MSRARAHEVGLPRRWGVPTAVEAGPQIPAAGPRVRPITTVNSAPPGVRILHVPARVIGGTVHLARAAGGC
jgi:hypothetical protein